MILTTEAVKDYMYCPMLFKYNYVKVLKPSKTTTIDKYALYCLNQSLMWYFHSAQDTKSIPSLGSLRLKFGEYYLKDRTVGETVFMSSVRFNRGRVLEKRCVEALHNFYNMFSKDLGVPILINKDYKISFSDIDLIGTIPVIRESSGRIQQLSFYPDILAGKATTLELSSHRDIDVIASSMAFKNLYGEAPDIHTSVGMFCNKTCNLKIGAPSYHNLETIISKVGKAIQENIYYPVYNDHCINCAYREKCIKEW